MLFESFDRKYDNRHQHEQWQYTRAGADDDNPYYWHTFKCDTTVKNL